MEGEECLKSKVSILEDGRNVTIECECLRGTWIKNWKSWKSFVYASKIKNVEKPNFKRRDLNYNIAPKNKNKRTSRVWVMKGTINYRNINCVTCFYCMQKGHTSNKCIIKHFDVPNGIYAWIPIIK